MRIAVGSSVPARLVAVGLLLTRVPAVWGQPAEPPPAAESPATRRRPIVEEIIVTAQKTEENVREVPISMSVIDEDFMTEQNISDLRDLAQFVPNAHVDPGNGLFPDINVRGFGSSIGNKAFEGSVGIAIDDISYARAPYLAGALFDVARVEVLRGPQGTLFGKNTTAGLFSVTTNDPTDELTGSIDLDLGDLGRRRTEAAAGGPVVEGLVNFRIAGVLDERDGIIRNTTATTVAGANRRMNDRDRAGLRAKLGFPNLLGANLVLAYERLEIEPTGIGWEHVIVPEQTLGFYRRYDPNFDLRPDNFVGSVDHPERNQNDIDTFTLDGDYDLGGWGLALVASHSLLRLKSVIDGDFGPSPSIVIPNSDRSPLTSAELRAASPSLAGFLGLPRLFGYGLGETDFVAGLYYQRRAINDSELRIALNLPVLAQFAAANMSPPGTPLPALEEFIGPAVPVGALGELDTTEIVAETTSFFEQTINSVAGFSNVNWRFLERWTLQYGMRFTYEWKNASWDRRFTPGTGAAFIALGGEEFTATLDRTESAFTPKVSLRYDWTDAIGFYGTWSLGFKAAGFNEQTFSSAEETLTYKPERAQAFELGSKMELLGGAARLNLALYRHVVEDLQVLTVEANSVVTIVRNAGKARAQGVELDAALAPATWATVVGTLAFNDSEFLDYPFGQCSFDREDTDGNGDAFCDLTGEPLFRTPKWAATVAPSVRFPFESIPGLGALSLFSARGLDLLAGVVAQYQDVQFIERSFDPRTRQSPFFRFNASIGVGHPDQGWSLRFVAENLTDRATNVLMRDVPLGPGNFTKVLEPPRTIFGAFEWRF